MTITKAGVAKAETAITNAKDCINCGEGIEECPEIEQCGFPFNGLRHTATKSHLCKVQEIEA